MAARSKPGSHHTVVIMSEAKDLLYSGWDSAASTGCGGEA
jgi:hypothetical protein